MIAHVFRAAPQSQETIPLLAERIAILRENGSILCKVSFVSPVTYDDFETRVSSTMVAPSKDSTSTSSAKLMERAQPCNS